MRNDVHFGREIKGILLGCKRYWGIIAAGLVCAMLSAALTVIGPHLIARITGYIEQGLVAGEIDLGGVTRVAFVLIAVYALGGLATYFQQFAMSRSTVCRCAILTGTTSAIPFPVSQTTSIPWRSLSTSALEIS